MGSPPLRGLAMAADGRRSGRCMLDAWAIVGRWRAEAGGRGPFCPPPDYGRWPEDPHGDCVEAVADWADLSERSRAGWASTAEAVARHLATLDEEDSEEDEAARAARRQEAQRRRVWQQAGRATRKARAAEEAAARRRERAVTAKEDGLRRRASLLAARGIDGELAAQAVQLPQARSEGRLEFETRCVGELAASAGKLAAQAVQLPQACLVGLPGLVAELEVQSGVEAAQSDLEDCEQTLVESVVELFQATPCIDDDGSNDDDADVFAETTVRESEVEMLAEVEELAAQFVAEGFVEKGVALNGVGDAVRLSDGGPQPGGVGPKAARVSDGRSVQSLDCTDRVQTLDCTAELESISMDEPRKSSIGVQERVEASGRIENVEEKSNTMKACRDGVAHDDDDIGKVGVVAPPVLRLEGGCSFYHMDDTDSEVGEVLPSDLEEIFSFEKREMLTGRALIGGAVAAAAVRAALGIVLLMRFLVAVVLWAFRGRRSSPDQHSNQGPLLQQTELQELREKIDELTEELRAIRAVSFEPRRFELRPAVRPRGRGNRASAPRCAQPRSSTGPEAKAVEESTAEGRAAVRTRRPIERAAAGLPCGRTGVG